MTQRRKYIQYVWKRGTLESDGRGYGAGGLGPDYNCHTKEFGFHPIYFSWGSQRILVRVPRDQRYFSMITPAAQDSNRKMEDESGGLGRK